MTHTDLSAKPTILIVEDSLTQALKLQHMLERHEYGVFTATNGKDALEMLRMCPPTLIITDINMPNMSGIEMIKELRKQPWCQRVPIMAITAYGNGVAKDALEAGADRAATKPIQFNSVIVEIKELLANKLRAGNSENDKG